jgi:demethylmenaquinone methyltransferase/2-methoxy-6-polyprenyl-1,4-benzoquinol methylase
MAKGVQEIFSKVPRTYELINHVLTLWSDVRWRKEAAELAAHDGGARWLDVCTGTGEMVANLAKNAGDGTAVFGADFSTHMVSEARRKPEADSINFTICDIANLPFRSDTFDLITISFATRNINKDRDALIKRLGEFKRVIKPGGRFINLETSQPGSRILRGLFHLYIRLFVRRVGHLISGSTSPYRYLSNTIPRFYEAPEFADIIRSAGFKSVKYRQMLFGAAAIHDGVKPL